MDEKFIYGVIYLVNTCSSSGHMFIIQNDRKYIFTGN